MKPYYMSKIIVIFFNLMIIIPASNGDVAVQSYHVCSTNISCGTIGNIRYPFWGGSRPAFCGRPEFQISCPKESYSYTSIQIGKTSYTVLDIDRSEHTITLVQQDLNNMCPESAAINTVPLIDDITSTVFSVIDQNDVVNLTLLNIPYHQCIDAAPNSSSSKMLSSVGCLEDSYYKLQCGHNLYDLLSRFNCSYDGTSSTTVVYYDDHQLRGFYSAYRCQFTVQKPVFAMALEKFRIGEEQLLGVLNRGFKVSYLVNFTACATCEASGGACGSSWASSTEFICYCPHGDYPSHCPGHRNKMVPVTGKTSNKKHHLQREQLSISLGFIVSIATAIGIAILGCLIFCMKRILHKQIPQNQTVEDCLKNYASLVPKRYTYTNIKKITKSFKEKLGEGGYGTVFQGKLHDGCVVAVKICKQSKGDGQDFINEVMSMSRTSHVNVVPLLGFCFEGHKRALIYEFMPNGSLEKFIHSNSLSTQKLFEIAVGIARGLEYLHRGCNTRIVHFDIKPHNILLDAEFIPKISKSLKKKESIISMSGARGTAGYIAPEVILRSFGNVSHKSDVYSFGMMVLEMVGCKKRENRVVENSSEMYFPRWIYKQLEEEASRVDSESALDEEGKESEKKMILVGLWCIQTNPLSRPPMSRVAEMLEGKVELLEVPPMPTLASLPRQQQQPTDDDSTIIVLSSTKPSTIDQSHSMQNVRSF